MRDESIRAICADRAVAPVCIAIAGYIWHELNMVIGMPIMG